MDLNYLELFKLALPETVLVTTVIAVLLADAAGVRSVDRSYRLPILGLVAALGCGLSAVFALTAHGSVVFQGGMLITDPLSRLVKVSILALTFFTVVISVESDFTGHFAEYLALVLMATLGMMLLVSTEHLLMIFVSLELTSLSLYILTAFNKRNIRSAEAAMKYFLFGGTAAAFTLFGLSLIYGLSGELLLSRIGPALVEQRTNPLFIAALVMVIVGFGFKVAAVPFHLWAPDAYQGAPTPSAALIASGSKVASFFVLARVVMLGFDGTQGSGSFANFAVGWMPVLAVLAAFSMVVGNFAAIVQTSVKRLLAYSAVAHAGYALLAILANDGRGVVALVYYTITYGLTTLGAFGVVAVVENETGDASLSDFAGLGRRAPILSFCMLIFMLSLAGIPPLAGFFGKFYLFAAAAGGAGDPLGLLWLVILAVAMSAVSLYYYLQVLKRIYVTQPESELPSISGKVIATAGVVLLAILVFVLGALPNLLVGPLTHALGGAGH